MKKRLLAVVMLGMVSSLLLGCPAPVVEQPQFVPPEEPRYGGTLVIPQPYSEFISMDPIRIGAGRAEDIQVIIQALEGLVKLDLVALKPVPALAERWEISDDLLTYTFYLRRGVKFHHGREVTVHDVKYSFERLMDPEEAAVPIKILENVKGVDEFRAGIADHISGIKVLDDYTVQITLEEVDVDFLYKLAEPGASIVPKEEVERLGADFGRTPVGTGPFRFVSWVGDVITLEAFEDYWGGRPYLDRLIWKLMLEPGAREAGFRAEELDLTILTGPQYVTFREDPLYRDYVVTVPELWTRNIFFNLEWGPFRDRRVRQAFNYAIDRATIVEKYLLGTAYPATGWSQLASPAFNPELKGYEFNPERARQLLEEAGYGDGFTVEIMGHPTHPAWGIPAVEAIMPYLEAVGIHVIPVPLESAARLHRRNTGDFQAGITSSGGKASPLLHLGMFHSTVKRADGNFPAYNNPRFDHYIDLARKEPDFEKRMELLRKAEEILVEDAPVWFFNYNKAVMVHQPWVHGLQPVALDLVYQHFDRVWIDERSPRAGE